MNGTILERVGVCLAILLTCVPVWAGDLTAEQAFDRLSKLAGTWDGSSEGSGAEAEASEPVVHEIEVSAAGTVVMETMQPGTDHEMINMYHLNGDELMLTHYCAGWNQPRMRLDLEASTADDLVFEFTGGTNLDPERDQYIGGARIQIVDSDRVESIWKGYNGREQVGTMTFHLQRRD